VNFLKEVYCVPVRGGEIGRITRDFALQSNFSMYNISTILLLPMISPETRPHLAFISLPRSAFGERGGIRLDGLGQSGRQDQRALGEFRPIGYPSTYWVIPPTPTPFYPSRDCSLEGTPLLISEETGIKRAWVTRDTLRPTLSPF